MPGATAAVVATLRSVNWSVADEAAEVGANVAVAPAGSPVVPNVAVHVPRLPVNDTFTEFAALAPYCTELPATTGFGVWDPRTCSALIRSTVVNVMSCLVVVVASHRVRIRAYSSRLAGMVDTALFVAVISPLS